MAKTKEDGCPCLNTVNIEDAKIGDAKGKTAEQAPVPEPRPVGTIIMAIPALPTIEPPADGLGSVERAVEPPIAVLCGKNRLHAKIIGVVMTSGRDAQGRDVSDKVKDPGQVRYHVERRTKHEGETRESVIVATMSPDQFEVLPQAVE